MELKKVAFFDTKPYDKESFERLNNGRYDIRYFETRLTAAALPLADGCDAACAFVNAEIDRVVVEGLVKRGIKVLAMRCAGYNNVDFKAAYESGLTVVRVPAYSPYAVAEHAAALLMTLTRHIHKAPHPQGGGKDARLQLLAGRSHRLRPSRQDGGRSRHGQDRTHLRRHLQGIRNASPRLRRIPESGDGA